MSKCLLWFLIIAPVASAQITGQIIGQPDSAYELTERVRTLADGTRITDPPQIRIIQRDSQGRTRTENLTPAGEIVIYDPMAGAIYTLDTRDHTLTTNRDFIIPRPHVDPLPEPGESITKRTSNPKTGDTTTILTTISRAEPDPSLFQVPADYRAR